MVPGAHPKGVSVGGGGGGFSSNFSSKKGGRGSNHLLRVREIGTEMIQMSES